MNIVLNRTIDGVLYDVLYKQVGTHTYQEVLVPRVEIKKDNNYEILDSKKYR